MFTEDTKHFMLDIETTGLVSALHGVTSLALVPFDFDAIGADTPLVDLAERAYNVAVSTDGLHVVRDAETMAWRRDNLVGAGEAHLPLKDKRQIRDYLTTRLSPHKKLKIWSCSPGFDMEFLEYDIFYKYSSLAAYSTPWTYKDFMDVRTLREVYPRMKKSLYSHTDEVMQECFPDLHPHNALYDCLAQIVQVREIIYNL